MADDHSRQSQPAPADELTTSNSPQQTQSTSNSHYQAQSTTDWPASMGLPPPRITATFINPGYVNPFTMPSPMSTQASGESADEEAMDIDYSTSMDQSVDIKEER
jgi:hypothetical protein